MLSVGRWPRQMLRASPVRKLFTLSPVTIAELKFGAEVATDARVRQRRLSALARLRRKPLLALDGDTGEIFGQLAAYLKARPRTPRHRVQDQWLASQSIQHSLLFLTRNSPDFDDIARARSGQL
jgi:predicted nucleic acid-binding protein